MNKFKILDRILELYNKNINIIDYLKRLDGNEKNCIEDILISYDFQAGTYIDSYKESIKLKQKYGFKLAKEIEQLGKFNSMLEVGVGEATTLAPLLQNMKEVPEKIYGFDISWSRIKYARKFLYELNIKNVNLFTGDLFLSPLKSNSIDIVYTNHSIEPNGGREEEALKELYRITNKYLILLEPAYELANDYAKKRMLENGYITCLYNKAKELGFNIIKYELFGINENDLNPTGIMIIKKQTEEKIISQNNICCPITKADIKKYDNVYFSEKSLLSYPIIDGIPCLLPQNAIITTKFLDNKIKEN